MCRPLGEGAEASYGRSSFTLLGRLSRSGGRFARRDRILPPFYLSLAAGALEPSALRRTLERVMPASERGYAEPLRSGLLAVSEIPLARVTSCSVPVPRVHDQRSLHRSGGGRGEDRVPRNHLPAPWSRRRGRSHAGVHFGATMAGARGACEHRGCSRTASAKLRSGLFPFSRSVRRSTCARPAPGPDHRGRRASRADASPSRRHGERCCRNGRHSMELSGETRE